MFAVVAAAGCACLLGAVDPVSASDGGVGTEILGLVRATTTSALVIALLLGPGILWRAASGRQIGLAFLPLPGLALLIATGGLAWLLAGDVDPKLVSFAVSAPVLGLLLGGLLGAGPDDLLDPEEQRALLLTSLTLGVAIARSLWSLSVTGELFEGTISRNLVAEGRPDSRISYFTPQLIANNQGPYSNESNLLFGPYNFSSRGPLPGLAASPIVFLSGGRPGSSYPEAPWRPFDPEGFMAYRLAIMAFGATALLSLWELVRRIGGTRVATFALLLGIATPFYFAELWFTWPKLLDASFVLLAGIFVLERKPFPAGVGVGLGYLMHPSALFGLSAAAPLTLWPAHRARLRQPRIRAFLLFAVGVAIFVVAWRLLNGSHFLQGPFLEYITQANPNFHPSVGAWLEYRAATVANTTIPFFLPLAYGHDHSINTFGGISPGVVHFFFQYWCGVPFGVAIIFFPLLLVSLWRALRRWPWAVTAIVIIPFLAFAIYWGANITGLLREGLQWWVVALLAVVAVQQWDAGFGWLRSKPIRAILALRGVEVLALAMGPVLGTHAFRPVSASLTVNDVAAVAGMIAFSLALVVVVWRETGRLGGAEKEQQAECQSALARSR
jgi:hypothetical protein